MIWLSRFYFFPLINTASLKYKVVTHFTFCFSNLLIRTNLEQIQNLARSFSSFSSCFNVFHFLSSSLRLPAIPSAYQESEYILLKALVLWTQGGPLAGIRDSDVQSPAWVIHSPVIHSCFVSSWWNQLEDFKNDGVYQPCQSQGHWLFLWSLEKYYYKWSHQE